MQGTLIYLMGPSGAGKDSLINAARELFAARGCYVAQRVITRAGDAPGEVAQSVTPAEFERLQAAGAFAMSWQANGLAYGIPQHIEQWLAAGRDVLVNGSRSYLPQAQERFGRLLAVMLTVNEEALRQRLLSRGRENTAQIEARLLRSRQLQNPVDGVFLLDNSGELSSSVAELLRLYDAFRG